MICSLLYSTTIQYKYICGSSEYWGITVISFCILSCSVHINGFLYCFKASCCVRGPERNGMTMREQCWLYSNLWYSCKLTLPNVTGAFPNKKKTLGTNTCVRENRLEDMFWRYVARVLKSGENVLIWYGMKDKCSKCRGVKWGLKFFEQLLKIL